jgi:hypothetical protein
MRSEFRIRPTSSRAPANTDSFFFILEGEVDVTMNAGINRKIRYPGCASATWGMPDRCDAKP